MNCKHCNSQLPIDAREGQEYCGPNCKALARYYRKREDPKPLAPRNCQWCEHEFTPPKHDTAKYCCNLCRISAINAETRKRNAQKRELVSSWDPEPRFCAQCGISFIPRQVNQKYHSTSCTRLAQKARAAEAPRKDYVPVPKPKPQQKAIVKPKPKPRVWVVRCDTVEQVRDYYGLDLREPAKPVAKSLAECEAMKGLINGTR